MCRMRCDLAIRFGTDLPDLPPKTGPGNIGTLTFVSTATSGSKLRIRAGPRSYTKKTRYALAVLRDPNH